VFAPWRIDNKRTLARVIDGDMEYMKLEKICKDEKDLPRIKKKLLDNVALLKDIHIDILSASDQLPNITWLDFTSFALECQFPDEVFQKANLDLLFVTVNSYEKGRNGLYRGEFFELILRVAKNKYFDSGKATSVSQAF